MKRRGPPKSLIKFTRGPAPAESGLELLAKLAKRNFLEESLSQIEATARALEQDARVERGAEYARRIREAISEVRHHCKHNNARSAAIVALRLGDLWTTARMDAIFAGPVRAREASQANLPKTSMITDEAIRAQFIAHETDEAAAEALGIGVRQLRRRISAQERAVLRARRKRTSER